MSLVLFYFILIYHIVFGILLNYMQLISLTAFLHHIFTTALLFRYCKLIHVILLYLEFVVVHVISPSSVLILSNLIILKAILLISAYSYLFHFPKCNFLQRSFSIFFFLSLRFIIEHHLCLLLILIL